MILLASLVALIIGPLLFNFTSKKTNMLDLFDGFIFVVIGGLVVFHILPESMEVAGLWSILFVLMGLIGPSVAESLFHKAAAFTHKSTLILGVVGLVVHSLTDGTALTESPDFDQLPLIIAVIAHRFPVGLTVWWLLRPHFGKTVALGVLVLMGVGTVLGSHFGAQWLPSFNETTIALLESFIAGSVLHVIFHRPYAEHHHKHQASNTHFDGVGSMLGLACLIAILFTGHQHEDDNAHLQLMLFVELAFTLAPFLLLAYALSSITKFWFSDNHPMHLRINSPSKFQTLRGALLGLPLPFCIPDATKAYQLLRKQGANTTMALAFLISAPILGFESLLVSMPLLGVEITVLRLLSAVVIVVIMALILSHWLTDKTDNTPVTKNDVSNRLQHALRHGYEHLLDHTAPWILVGLILATLLTFGQHQAHWSDIFLVAALALPFRLCATGLTPLAAAMLVSGWDVGSVMILMLIGPTISIELIRFVAKEHGKKLAAIFTLLLPLAVITCGWIINNVLKIDSDNLLQLDHGSANALEMVSLTIILLLVAWSLLRRGARAFVAELLPKLNLFSHNHKH